MPTIEFGAVLYLKRETLCLGAKQNFFKREIIVEETNPAASGKVYTELIKMFVIGQDNCDAVDNFAIGDRILIKCTIKGRPWESPDKGTVYFTELNVLALHPADDEYGNTEAGDNPESRYINPNDLTHEDILLDLEKKEEATKPEEKTLFGDDPESDLPFALMIPLAIGFLTQFIVL